MIPKFGNPLMKCPLPIGFPLFHAQAKPAIIRAFLAATGRNSADTVTLLDVLSKYPLVMSK